MKKRHYEDAFKLLNLIKKVISESGIHKDGSVAVTDHAVLQNFIDNPDFPFLISFPRTGSHWLRMIMELYFERPSLVRVFYYGDRKDYLTLHTHDMDLDVFRKNVIYLYRKPIPTVYSQMIYEREDINDLEKVKYWAAFYGRHLNKWLIQETFSEKKTIVSYENMSKNITEEFSKITAHFNRTFDPIKLQAVADRISKKEVKSRTMHDQKVINLNREYAERREQFADKFGAVIEDIIFAENSELAKFLD